MIKHLGFTNQTLLTVAPMSEVPVNARSCVNTLEILPNQTYSSILESVSSPVELHWKRRIALAALTDATKVNSEVYLTELPTVTESTAPIIVDEGFESENGELDHHMSDNTISENLSVANNSVDIIMNDTCDEIFKCYNITEVSEPEMDRGRTATRKIKRKKIKLSAKKSKSV